jgi:hypothetical protein
MPRIHAFEPLGTRVFGGVAIVPIRLFADRSGLLVSPTSERVGTVESSPCPESGSERSTRRR